MYFVSDWRQQMLTKFGTFFLFIYLQSYMTKAGLDNTYEPYCKYYTYQSKCCTNHNSNIWPWYNCWVFIILFFLFILILMGFLKSLTGLLYCSCVGGWGLDLLIDLPRPLPQYQEPWLACREVVYDEAGWPVHPDTGERTVKVLTGRTEFFLNLIFFIAYPLALLVKLIEMSCCIRSGCKDDENVSYKQVNVIKMMEGCLCSCRSTKQGPVIDRYREGDVREEQDTEYVVEILKESKHSLKGSFCGFH
ncbi:hypothetical protein WA026_017562 [Henosepilachna vigintioctopunctata]|uniref:Uncharacterized protein n=1 Tax=Henosepilachna vigintioctopunctata TaxID=420089 RepID=A0AAW1V0H6_9CUCU